MRNLYLKFSAVAACAFFAVACASGDSDFPETGSGDELTGTVCLSSVSTSIAETRALDASNYDVKVWRVRGVSEVLVTGIPTNVSGFSAPVTLPVGDYRLEVSSPGVALPAFESPIYKGGAEFSVSEGANTPVDVTCTPVAVKVTLHYSRELVEILDTGSAQVTVTINGGSLAYTFGETRGGYFAASESTTMTVEFEGTVNSNYVSERKIISDVEPGEWEKVFLGVEGDGRLVIVYDSEAGQIGDGGQWF